MHKYIDKILTDLPEKYNGTAVTPAAEHLFNVDPKQQRLTDIEAQNFHHVVAQLLFLCKRVQPDIQTAVLFLTTRVKNRN